MPPRRNAASKSKAPVDTSAARPRGRPPKPKDVKSKQFINDEAEDDVVDITSSDEDKKSVKVIKKAEIIGSDGSDDDFEMAEPTVSTHKSQRTASGAKATRKCAASVLSTDEDVDVRMSESPKKKKMTPQQRVTSADKAKSVSPIKNFQDTRIKNMTLSKSVKSDDDVFGVSPSKSSNRGSVKNVKYDSDDAEPYSGFEEDSLDDRKKAKKGLKGNAPLDKESDGSDSDSPDFSFMDRLKKSDVKEDDSSDERHKFKKSVKANGKGVATYISSNEDDSSDQPKKVKKKGKCESDSDEDTSDFDNLKRFDEIITSEAPPDKDKSNVGNHDEHLIKTYRRLVNIRASVMCSWSVVEGPGNPTYSGILKTCSSIDEELLFSATVFDKQDKIPVANLSRVDPAYISIGLNGKRHFHCVGKDHPLLFTSVITVDQCYLDEGRTMANGKMQKVIRGSLMEGEFERFVGAIGMIIGERQYNAQIYRDVLDFSTFMSFDSGPSISTTPVKGGKPSTSGQQSPFLHRGRMAVTVKNAFASKACLACKDIVPIYDAREAGSDFSHILTELYKLPRYPGDVPTGSCVVVGYTASTFTRKDEEFPSISFNIHWVVLLALAGRKVKKVKG